MPLKLIFIFLVLFIYFFFFLLCRSHRMGLKEAQLVMFCVWTLVFFLSAVPLFGIEYFKDFYSRSGVCLAFHITPDRPRGWEYSVMIFLAVNLFSFVVIFISYLWMFIVARKTRSAVRTAEAKTDSAMAKRITLIVLTDFFCWVPIIMLGIASLCGARIPPEVSAFYLPSFCFVFLFVWLVGWLVSFFNAISTIVGYLILESLL